MYLGDLNLFEWILFVGGLLSLVLFVPTTLIMSCAYFANKGIKKHSKSYISLLFVLLIAPFTLVVLMELFMVMANSMGVMTFLTSVPIFLSLVLIVFRKAFISRTKYWFYKIFCSKIPQKEFDKPIANIWLSLLLIASLLIAYFSGWHHYTKLYLVDSYSGIIGINIIIILFDLVICMFWRTLFFK